MEVCRATKPTARQAICCDLYAAADIPETEIFGSTERTKYADEQVRHIRRACERQAACLCRSFTWLNEHFQRRCRR